MSRRWFEDTFKLVLVSSTQVKLAAPSHVTIGGKQYHLFSDLFYTPAGLAADTIYMVYAVQTGGVVSLVHSANFNSVGPVGYATWKLVGAVLTNNASQMGSLIDLNTGNSEPMVNNAAYTMHANFGTLVYRNVYQQKLGSILKVHGSWLFGTVASGADTYIQIPFTIDFTRFPDGATQSIPRGSAEVRHATTNAIWGGILGLKLFTDANTATNQLFASYNVAAQLYSKAQSNVYTTGQGFGFQLEVPVVGWSSTPLKDL